MNLERFKTFNPVFANPAHHVTLSPIEDLPREQMIFSIEQAIFWLEASEAWAKEYGSCNEGAWDLNIAKLYAEAGRISATKKAQKLSDSGKSEAITPQSLEKKDDSETTHRNGTPT